jgi:hypothetical protein
MKQQAIYLIDHILVGEVVVVVAALPTAAGALVTAYD